MAYISFFVDLTIVVNMLLSDYPVPNVGIQHKQDNTKAFVDGTDTGTGAVYIAER